MPAPERPLAERLTKWQHTWRRIAERVLNEDYNSLVQEAHNESEVNNHDEDIFTNN